MRDLTSTVIWVATKRTYSSSAIPRCGIDGAVIGAECVCDAQRNSSSLLSARPRLSINCALNVSPGYSRSVLTIVTLDDSPLIRRTFASRRLATGGNGAGRLLKPPSIKGRRGVISTEPDEIRNSWAIRFLPMFSSRDQGVWEASKRLLERE